MFVTNNSGVMCECGSDGHEELAVAEDYASFDFYADRPLPANTVMSGPFEQPQTFEWDDADVDRPEAELYWSTGPPIPDTIYAAQAVYFPDESEEPDPEPFGFDDYPLVADTVLAASRVYYPDESEEPDDEAFGFVDWQTPPGAAAPTDIPSIEDASSQPEDEEEAFGFESQSVPDDMQGSVQLADDEQAEEEAYGFVDYQIPPDAVAAPTGIAGIDDASTQLEEEDEALGFESGPVPDDMQGGVQLADDEDAESEDYGFTFTLQDDDQQGGVELSTDAEADEEIDGSFSDDPRAADNDVSADIADRVPDQSEEPEDEDYGSADMQMPEDFIPDVPPAPCQFDDQADEPEDEDYSFADLQVPEDAQPVAVLPGAGRLPFRKKRRYYVDIDGQTYHGTLAQVQAYIVAKADADRESEPAAPVISQQKLPQTLSYPLAQVIAPLPSLLEYNTVAQLQQLYLDLLRNSVASAPQDAYNVALIQQQLAEQDDEEAIFALLH